MLAVGDWARVRCASAALKMWRKSREQWELTIASSTYKGQATL